MNNKWYIPYIAKVKTGETQLGYLVTKELTFDPNENTEEFIREAEELIEKNDSNTSSVIIVNWKVAH